MSDKRYLSILRELIEKMQKKNPFIVVLNEYEIGVSLSWPQYYRLYAHIKK